VELYIQSSYSIKLGALPAPRQGVYKFETCVKCQYGQPV